MKHELSQWSRVSREDVEFCASARFLSRAATNILIASKEYADPVFYSLHIGAFAVLERLDATKVFMLGTRESRLKQARGQHRRWAIKNKESAND